jgi:signal transduction histidine kinase/ActR/RegA family two-component response regulator
MIPVAPRAALPSTPGARRVLLLAPTGRDAELTSTILRRADFETTICDDAEQLCAAIQEGAGLAVMTAEALTGAVMRKIAGTLATQPAWSELPLMIFVAQPDMERAARSFEPLGPRAQITLVDRPIHVKTLVSAARAALRSRIRQYEIRDLLEQLEERLHERDRLLFSERAHAERLSGLAQASLAIASALSLDHVLQMITDEACKVIETEVALTTLHVDDKGRTRSVRSMSCARNCEEWQQELGSESERALDALAHELRAPIRLEADQLREHPLGKVFDPDHTQCVLAAPLVERDGGTVGVIALGKKIVGTFSEEDESVLMQLAQMASAALQNARLYREAQEANRVKDDFLATLAHELRTPMTGILGWVQMLKMDGANEDDIRMAIQMIESSTRVQARLVEDLLDVSRIIAGKLRIEYTAVELAPVIEEVVETFRARAEERKIKLSMQAEALPLSVYGDETRLHQVIWNLLSNAIKFTPAGGTVSVELVRDGNRANIRVRDSGHGIDPDFVPFIFERFRQADNTTTRQQSGLGLGLAIVRHLVELHSGTVNVESKGAGTGTLFTVTLPLTAVRMESAEAPDARGRSDAPQLSGVNVLVVDDEEDAGAMVASVLRELGADARSATSVTAALALLRSFAADVIVSDIAMPGEDGYALMHRLRELEPELGREVPAMALTGYGRPEDRSRILASGFQKYVQKPVEPMALAHAISSLIQSS